MTASVLRDIVSYLVFPRAGKHATQKCHQPRRQLERAHASVWKCADRETGNCPMISRSTKRPRFTLGTVVEVSLEHGLAYAQYVARHKLYGPFIRVIDSVTSRPRNDLEQLVQEPTRFFTSLVWDKFVPPEFARLVGRAPVPEEFRKVPLLRGRYGMQSKPSRWYLWNEAKATEIHELTSEFLELSLNELWNVALLRERIASGWRPRDEK